MKKLICFLLIAVTSLGAIAQEKHYRHSHSYAPQYYGPVIPDNRREWGAFLLGSVLAPPVYNAPPPAYYAPSYSYAPPRYEYNPYPRTCWQVEQFDPYIQRRVIRTICQ